MDKLELGKVELHVHVSDQIANNFYDIFIITLKYSRWKHKVSLNKYELLQEFMQNFQKWEIESLYRKLVIFTEFHWVVRNHCLIIYIFLISCDEGFPWLRHLFDFCKNFTNWKIEVNTQFIILELIEVIFKFF